MIARRRHYHHAPPDRLIERLFQGLFPFGGRLRQGKAKVDHSRAGVDTFDDRRGKLLGRRTRHLFAARGLFGENWAD